MSADIHILPVICVEHDDADTLDDCDGPNVVNLRFAKLMRSASPWESRYDVNEALLSRLRGVPAQPGTPESDADPQNPNVR